MTAISKVGVDRRWDILSRPLANPKVKPQVKSQTTDNTNNTSSKINLLLQNLVAKPPGPIDDSSLAQLADAVRSGALKLPASGMPTDALKRLCIHTLKSPGPWASMQRTVGAMVSAMPGSAAPTLFEQLQDDPDAQKNLCKAVMTYGSTLHKIELIRYLKANRSAAEVHLLDLKPKLVVAGAKVDLRSFMNEPLKIPG